MAELSADRTGRVGEKGTVRCKSCGTMMTPEATATHACVHEREWFVSYDVTQREILLQRSGDDPHPLDPDEATALRDELLAASVAAHEHSVLLGDDPTPVGRPSDG